jgi:general secretion pathway protein A
MLLDYYNLKEQPFGATPDPRYLYMSPTHREALASLCYGIQSARGFMSIIAKPGMGKTTILFQLLNELQPSARTVFLFQTLCRPEDLLPGILRELGAAEETADVLRMQSQLDHILHAEAQQGRKVVVVIDEAQNLEDSALELLRMLSNFETPSEKLLQIVLAGQPQLNEKLASPRLLQLRQRMSIFARLSPLNLQESHLYIEHRLRVAGYDFQVSLFTPQAEALIARHSEGIPRNINNICFNALSLGWVLKQRTIEQSAVREVLDDLDLDRADTDRLEGPGLPWMSRPAVTPRKALRSAFAWGSRVALFLALLPLLWTTSKPRNYPADPVPSSVKVAESVPSGGALPSQTQPAPPSTSDRAQDPVRSQPASTVKTADRRAPADLPQTASPDELWKQVKRGRSQAEVELARMYLEGAGVERNCAQAQVLLQDASRKGNPHAASLLAEPSNPCH